MVWFGHWDFSIGKQGHGQNQSSKSALLVEYKTNSNTINVHVTSRLHCRGVQRALPEGTEQHNGIINK
jgi:hypothetical protein